MRAQNTAIVWKKLRERLLAASVLAVSTALGWGSPLAAQEATPTLLLYGDSLMAGYGLSPNQGFAAQLEAALAEQGIAVEIENASVSGDTSGNGVERLDWSLTEIPDAALVGLGANDMLRGLPVAEVDANLTAILDRFAAEGVPVLLLGMRSNRGQGEAYVTAFDALYADLAASYTNVDLYPFFLEGVALDPALNLPDRLHPNARGVAEIVARITPQVVALLDAGD